MRHGSAERSERERAPERRATRCPEWLARAALAIAGISLVAIGLELGLRVYHAARESIEVASFPEIGRRMFVPSPDPGLVYELRPGATKGEFRVNRWGMAGPDVERDKPPGVFRIAVVGDSISCGFDLVGGELGFPARVRQLLQVREGEQRRVEVLNFGVNGYGILQELQMTRARALGFRPDLLILQLTLNDPHPTGMPPYTPDRTRSWSYTWDFLLRRIAPHYYEGLRVAVRNYDEEGIGNVRKAMRGFGEVQRSGTPILAVMFPYLALPAYRDWGFDRFHGLFEDEARSNGIPFLDLREVFERERIFDQRWLKDPVHPSEEGHRIAAQAIVAKLDGLGLLEVEPAPATR